jgi:hypothetical protein
VINLVFNTYMVRSWPPTGGNPGQGEKDMSTVFVSHAIKTTKGHVFAPGKCEITGTYSIWKLCANYDSNVRGGLRKTWRYVQKGLTLEQAKDMLNKKAAS